MNTILRRRSVRIKAMILALMVAASLAVLAPPATALPRGCSYGIGYNQVGAFRAYYGWAYCPNGTGYYRANAYCWHFGTLERYPGTVKRVGQDVSRAACPHNARPERVGYSVWD